MCIFSIILPPWQEAGALQPVELLWLMVSGTGADSAKLFPCHYLYRNNSWNASEKKKTQQKNLRQTEKFLQQKFPPFPCLSDGSAPFKRLWHDELLNVHQQPKFLVKMHLLLCCYSTSSKQLCIALENAFSWRCRDYSRPSCSQKATRMRW